MTIVSFKNEILYVLSKYLHDKMKPISCDKIYACVDWQISEGRVDKKRLTKEFICIYA